MSFKINKNTSERTKGITYEDLDITNSPLFEKHFPSRKKGGLFDGSFLNFLKLMLIAILFFVAMFAVIYIINK